nr:helix-turn-helix domain-containing protein [Flavonifractor sp. An306]
MTFNECKSLLKIGKNTLLDLLHNGEIEAFRIGNRWKIPKKSVLDYIRYL